jgi:hypothetical protein
VNTYFALINKDYFWSGQIRGRRVTPRAISGPLKQLHLKVAHRAYSTFLLMSRSDPVAAKARIKGSVDSNPGGRR